MYPDWPSMDTAYQTVPSSAWVGSPSIETTVPSGNFPSTSPKTDGSERRRTASPFASAMTAESPLARLVAALTCESGKLNEMRSSHARATVSQRGSLGARDPGNGTPPFPRWVRQSAVLRPKQPARWGHRRSASKGCETILLQRNDGDGMASVHR